MILVYFLPAPRIDDNFKNSVHTTIRNRVTPQESALDDDIDEEEEKSYTIVMEDIE
jgi:hypothetical protein